MQDATFIPHAVGIDISARRRPRGGAEPSRRAWGAMGWRWRSAARYGAGADAKPELAKAERLLSPPASSAAAGKGEPAVTLDPLGGYGICSPSWSRGGVALTQGLVHLMICTILLLRGTDKLAVVSHAGCRRMRMPPQYAMARASRIPVPRGKVANIGA